MIFFFLLTFLFEIAVDPYVLIRNNTERFLIPWLIFPIGNILQNNSTVSLPGYWHHMVKMQNVPLPQASLMLLIYSHPCFPVSLPLLSLLGTTLLFSISIAIISRVLHKWNHKECNLLGLAFFTFSPYHGLCLTFDTWKVI